ncbi:MAG: sulfatase [Deltaproteobacteria bacterium]|nr:sulfatase [Deltaproteobacteria bacterium]MBW2153113.1 sulfatase [Deltaproteobacteria bacterium]
MNIIVIMIDSLRYDHVGCYGNNWIKTPNLDKLADESVVFENAYPEGIPTVPVRTSLFTGNKTLNSRYWQPLAPEDVTMAEILDEYNYLNMMVTDCYHLFKPNMNFSRGFHGYEFIRGQEIDAWRTDPHKVDLSKHIKPEQYGDRYVRGLDQYLRNVQDREKEEDYFVAQVMGKASWWLEKNHNHPIFDKFFLYVDCFDPHEPWDAPEPYGSMYTDPNYKGTWIIWPKGGPYHWLTQEELKNIRALYAGEVSFVDKWVGVLLDKIRDLNLMDNSIIILLSDHGHPLGDHEIMAKFGDNLYSELLRIPMMIRFPGKEYAGKRIKALVEIPDILPTVLDFIGHRLDLEYLNGKSLMPLIKGEVDKVHQYVVTGFFGSEARCIRDEQWSFIRRPADQRNELYNLIEDPKEKNNLVDKNPEKAQEMNSAISGILNCRLQKEHWLQLRYDVPGMCEGRHPPYARWVK